MNEEINAEIQSEDKIENVQPNQIVERNEKSITDLSISDVKFSLDKTKSYDEQAEEVVNAIATAKAVADAEVSQRLTEKKAEELKFKSEARAKNAEMASIDAEKGKQEAERQLYEGVLQTFGITKHLPQWLMRIMVMMLAPIYLILTLVIGVPFGVMKTIIDNADNVLCRYEKVDENIKPHLKFTIWFLLIIAILVGIAFIVLKIFNKI